MATLTRDEQIRDALTALGGAAPLGRIAERAHLTRQTVHRALSSLMNRGVVARSRSGYALTDDPALTLEARAVLRTLSTLELDAHITGLDLLGALSQQFLASGMPHLVHVDHGDEHNASEGLRDAGYLVVRAERNLPQLATPVAQVILRAVSGDLADRLGVVAHRALPEKAWVDMTREALRGGYPLSAYDCGQILGAGIRSGMLERSKVRAVALRANMTSLVRAIDGAPTRDDERALVEGVASELGA